LKNKNINNKKKRLVMNSVNFSNICPLVDFNPISELGVTINYSVAAFVTDYLGLVLIGSQASNSIDSACRLFSAGRYKVATICAIEALFYTSVLAARIPYLGSTGEGFSGQTLFWEKVGIAAAATTYALSNYVFSPVPVGPAVLVLPAVPAAPVGPAVLALPAVPAAPAPAAPVGPGLAPALATVAVPSPVATGASRPSL
jgi:hypothetical protein